MKKTILTILTLLIMTSIISGCEKKVEITTEKEASIVNTQKPTDKEAEVKEVKKEPRIEMIRIAAVGDIMMHSGQITAGYVGGENEYDFNSVFKPVKQYIENADIAIGNLETTLSGKDKGYTGYPAFNSPEQLASALKNVGFDILTTANNHSLDRRFYGVEHTLNVLDKIGLSHTGTSRTQEEQNTILMKEVNNIKVAFISYTYGTNGIPFDKGKEFSVNIIDKEKILSDIKKAKEQGADVISASMHFGDEYQRQPNEKQRDLVQFLSENGVDIILGSHPHVLEPIEIRKVKTIDGQEKEVFVIYSMGNFVSNQRERYRDAGVILNIKLSKNFETNKINIEKVEYIPTWVDVSNVNGKSDFRVLPVRETIDYYDIMGDKLVSEDDLKRLERTLEDTTILFKQDNLKIDELIRD